MADLDRAVGDGVGDLQARNDLAAAKTCILNRLSVISATALANTSEAP